MAATMIGLTDSKIQGLKAPASGRIELADKVLSQGSGFALARPAQRRSLSANALAARSLTSPSAASTSAASRLPTRAKRRGSCSMILRRAATLARRLARPAGFAAAPSGRCLTICKKAKAGLRSIGEIERIFDRYVLPEIGDRLADSINRADVTRLVDGVAAPVMARAVAAQLSAFYSWAMPRLHRLEVNPCRDAGKPD